MNQLISSQLDMDRLDYLKRDSFYTGASEGNINSERIIEMLNVKDDKLIVDEKGIYSVEEFLVARRLMYWQVYLHKTSIGAEFLLIRILKRAKELIERGEQLPMSSALAFFVKNRISIKEFDDKALEIFSQLDDSDIISALKEWQNNKDFVLSRLSKAILNRELFRLKIYKNPIDKETISVLRQKVEEEYKLEGNLIDYFVFTGEISNIAYNKDYQNILIYTKNRRIVDVAEASDQMNLEALSTKVTKYYLCCPKDFF